MKFKVGDKIRGISDNYLYTDKNMALGEVMSVEHFGIKIKILEHTNKSQIGKIHWVITPEEHFELVEKNEMSTLETLEKKYKEIGEEIERLKEEKENERWVPKVDDCYWYVDNDGCIHETEWTHFGIHRRRYLIGNVFKTEEEAEFRVGQLKVEAELRRFARPFEENKSNWSMIYEVDNKKIAAYNYTSFHIYNIRFASEEIAQKAIDTVGAERIKKYYFGV
ncbi:hypothetical protein [Globicatella sanguinis]